MSTSMTPSSRLIDVFTGDSKAPDGSGVLCGFVIVSARSLRSRLPVVVSERLVFSPASTCVLTGEGSCDLRACRSGCLGVVGPVVIPDSRLDELEVALVGEVEPLFCSWDKALEALIDPLRALHRPLMTLPHLEPCEPCLDSPFPFPVPCDPALSSLVIRFRSSVAMVMLVLLLGRPCENDSAL